MTIASLATILNQARQNNQAIAGLVVLGWEDITAFIAAAEAENMPVILQAGPGCRAHTPIPVLGAMFRYAAERASVPIVCHLDHGYEIQEIEEAIQSGFSSVMIDGSKKPLSQNIEITGHVVSIAHRAGVSVEGEIGIVGYMDGLSSQGTEPDEAARLARETGVDALAISAGNTHLQTQASAIIDEVLVEKIAQRIECPIVLHGGSGIPHSVRRRLARKGLVSKFNIGTELRQVFGSTLRKTLDEDPNIFDRLTILKTLQAPLCDATRHIIANLK
jgi:fructose-bisphosphate aldolase class II